MHNSRWGRTHSTAGRRSMRTPWSRIAATLWLFAWGIQGAALADDATEKPTDAPAAAPGVQRISADDFGALPFMMRPQLSPNGSRLAVRAYVKDVRTRAMRRVCSRWL